jgi:hypothetical protein
MIFTSFIMWKNFMKITVTKIMPSFISPCSRGMEEKCAKENLLKFSAINNSE